MIDAQKFRRAQFTHISSNGLISVVETHGSFENFLVLCLLEIIISVECNFDFIFDFVTTQKILILVYKSPEYDILLYNNIINRLILLGYPEQLRCFPYEQDFAIRGNLSKRTLITIKNDLIFELKL